MKTKTFWLLPLFFLCSSFVFAQSPQPARRTTRPWVLPSDVSVGSAPRRARANVNTSISSCNNNGFCEPWLGDSCTTCADCIGNAQCAQLAQVCNWYNFVGGKPGPVSDQCLNGTYTYLYYGLRYIAEKYAAPGSNIVNESGTPFTPGDGKCNQTPDASVEGGSCGGFPRESCANDPQDCGPCPTIENITDPNIGLGSCDPTECAQGVCTVGQCSTTTACQFNCGSAHYGGSSPIPNTHESDAVDFSVSPINCSAIATLANSICPPGGANFVSYGVETPGTLHVSINTLAGAFLAVLDNTGAIPVSCPSPNGGPPNIRAWSAGSAINNILFAVGGGACNTCSGFGGNEVPTVEIYDSTQGSWYSKAPLQAARFGASASSANGKVYAIGGTSGNQSFPVGTVEEYDPGADSWSAKTNMPTPRWKLTSAAVNGIIYTIGGGGSGNQCVPTGIVEAYNPTADAWTTKTPVPSPVWGAASDVINGQIYVVGGSQECPQISVIVSAALEVYDPITDTWAGKSPMSTPRWDLAAAAENGKLYAIGGWDPVNQKALDIVEQFDPATNSWMTRSHMPTARSGLIAAAINGKIYAFEDLTSSISYLPLSKSTIPRMTRGRQLRRPLRRPRHP